MFHYNPPYSKCSEVLYFKDSYSVSEASRTQTSQRQLNTHHLAESKLGLSFFLVLFSSVGNKNNTYPFKTRNLHCFKRCSIKHDWGAKFKDIAKEFIRLR